MVHLSDVLGLIYGLSIGAALALTPRRIINRLENDSQPKAPEDHIFFLTALSKIIDKSWAAVGFSLLILWLLGTSENMTIPEIGLLMAPNVGWRFYVLVSVVGVSLIMSAFGCFFGEATDRILKTLSRLLKKSPTLKEAKP